MLSIHGNDLSRPVAQFVTPVGTALAADQTVDGAMASLRARKIEQKVLYFYVVDHLDKLVGVVPARKLLLADPQTAVREVMEHSVSIPATAKLEEAMELFAMYRLLALPVVDYDGRLMGIIDVQLYADEAIDLAEADRLNDLFQLMGVSVKQLRQNRAWPNYRVRMPWLVCNIVGGLACAVIAWVFRGALERVLLLAMFIPLVLTLSEAVAMQSMTLVLQFLRGKTDRRVLMQSMGLEWRTATMLGLTCALVVGVGAAVYGAGIPQAGAVGLSIFLSMLSAASIGAFLPVVLHRAKLDPKVAAGPVVLMIADVVTTTIYLGFGAMWLA